MGRLDKLIMTMSDLFEEYNNDENKKRLDMDEIEAMLEKEVNIENFEGKITLENIKEALKKADKNKDKEVKLLEFCNAMTQLAILYCRRSTPGERKQNSAMPHEVHDIIEKFEDLFDEYSSDETDCLSREQFKALVTDEINSPDYDGKLELSDIDEFFDKLDRNDDGQLTFQEFIGIVGKMIQCHRKKAGRKGRKGGRGGGGKGGKGGRGGRGGRGGSSDDDEERRGGRGGKGGRGGNDDDEERRGGHGGRGGKGGKGGRGGF
ncbi:uncharacterized protein LOC144022336 [Festucalex cinctus]